MRFLIVLCCCAVLAPGIAEGGRSDREARAHKKAGLRHLEKEHYDRAIKELQRAYDLGKEPVLLFHIAEAYNAKKDYAKALEYYRAYRDADPKGAAKRNVDAVVDALGALVGEPPPPPPPDPETEPPPPPPPPPDPETHPPPPPPDPLPEPPPPPAHHGSPGRGLRIAGIGVAVVGLAAVGAGGYFASGARDRADRISEVFDTGGTWSDEYTRLYDEGETAEQRSVILLAAGGVTVAGGAILYYLGARAGAASHVEVAPTAGGGAMVQYTWHD